MLTNILVPALGLILLTFVIGLIHTIASVNLMGKGKDWEESGIPIEPYKDAPLHLKIIKNNISNIFEFSVIFYFLIGVIVFIEVESTFSLKNWYLRYFEQFKDCILEISSSALNGSLVAKKKALIKRERILKLCTLLVVCTCISE